MSAENEDTGRQPERRSVEERDPGRRAAGWSDAHGVLLDEAARLWVETGGGLLPVSGRSMKPTFEDATRVWIERTEGARFGDILVYTNGGFLVVHRVVGVRRGPRYRTKGDGLPHLDLGFVPASRSLGTVVAVDRAGARWRTDGAGGRLYARLLGSLSAIEGLFYRIAWRIDRLLAAVLRANRGRPGYAGGVTIARRSVRAVGRLVIGLADGLLFSLLHSRRPGEGKAPS